MRADEKSSVHGYMQLTAHAILGERRGNALSAAPIHEGLGFVVAQYDADAPAGLQRATSKGSSALF